MNTARNLAGDELIVLTASEYAALIEDAGDAALAEQARQDNAGAPALTAEAMEAVLNGDLHPLTAFREAAGLTQTRLASEAGVRIATISDIETGKLDPRLSTMKALAKALGVDVDDIIV